MILGATMPYAEAHLQSDNSECKGVTLADAHLAVWRSLVVSKAEGGAPSGQQQLQALQQLRASQVTEQ